MNIPKGDLILILNGNQKMIDKYKNIIEPNKKCAYCGKSFITNKRTDEIYCPNCIHISSDRKCMKSGNVKKIKYRREYKKMHAKLMRGDIERTQFSKHMEEYKERIEKEV